MSNSYAQKMSSINSEEDLWKLFSGYVDRIVIEDVVKSYNNDLTKAYQGLLEITNFSYLGHPNLSLNNCENQLAVSNSDTTNFINLDRLSKNETTINRISYLISNHCKVMVLMRGCPGSGKSFQAINILNLCYQNANVDEFIFSADKYFIDKKTGKYIFISSKLSSAHEWTYNKAQKAVQYEVTPVIIDNTNIQAWEMERYVKLAVINGYWIEIVEPVSEWAWDTKMLFNKTKHSVPFDTIHLMIQRYDHSINRENLLTKFALKYSENNTPPKRSNSLRKYKLVKNLLDKRELVHTTPTGINTFSVNTHFKDLCISQNNDDTNNNQCTDIDNSSEGTGIKSLIPKKKPLMISKFKNLSCTIHSADEECQSTFSDDEGASNYINKSVNTCKNEFLVMDSLNKIPLKEYSNHVIFGKNRDINKGNRKVLNLSVGKFDKSSSTHDLTKTMCKEDFSENDEILPDISISLIIELYEHHKGNFDLIWKSLIECGYSLSKQQLQSVLQLDKDDVQIKSTENKIVSKQTKPLEKFNSKNKTLKTINEKAETSGKILKHNLSRNSSDSKITKTKNLISVKDDEKFIQLVLKTSVLTQLCDYFHDVFSNPSNNVLMTVQIPEQLANDLYCYLISNVASDTSNQEAILRNSDNTIMSDNIKENLTLVRDDKEKFVQLVLETSVLSQLCDYFNDIISDFGNNTSMSVRIPEQLAKDLYYYLISNVPSDTSNEKAILKDKILPKKLEKIIVENKSLPKISNKFSGEKSFSAVLSKPKIEKYKNVKDNHRDTHFKNMCNLGNTHNIQSSTRSINQDRLKIISNEFQKYKDLAKLKTIEEEFKNKMDSKTIDLHHLLVPEATHIIDLFLDNHILALRKQNGGFPLGNTITIITGRGNHSPRNKARIKPAVLDIISAREILPINSTDGAIVVTVKKTSLLSTEIKYE